MLIITQSSSAETDHSGRIEYPEHSTVSPGSQAKWPFQQATAGRRLETAGRYMKIGSLRRAFPRLGESSNAGSRLSEIPLAWASCLLAQKGERVAWARFRAEISLFHLA